jgi:hypothetical protein
LHFQKNKNIFVLNYYKEKMSKIPIGDNMYLFKSDDSKFAKKLVISAHGAIRRINSPAFTNLFAELIFYSKHGKTTDDLGIDRFGSGTNKNQITDTIYKGFQCFDYSLTKYQGRHQNGWKIWKKVTETYDSIQKNQNLVKGYVETVAMQKAKEPNFKSQYNFEEFDVLTIRNHGPSVTLKKALEQVGYINKYAEIHCYFCRSFYI